MNEKSEALAGVTVQAKSVSDRDRHISQTDSSGLFHFQNLLAGISYELTVSSVGYETAVIKNYLVSQRKVCWAMGREAKSMPPPAAVAAGSRQ